MLYNILGDYIPDPYTPIYSNIHTQYTLILFYPSSFSSNGLVNDTIIAVNEHEKLARSVEGHVYIIVGIGINLCYRHHLGVMCNEAYFNIVSVTDVLLNLA